MSRCATNLPWGYNEVRQSNNQALSPDVPQYANLPAALLSTLKRDKKPFTYTPGGVNLSEVLEARLQKRMERKKKYVEEQQEHRGPLLVVSNTYNTPLDMYSMENALETLEMQANMAASRSPSSYTTLPRNYKFKCRDEDEDAEPSQSKAFRVLQVMTDTEQGYKNQTRNDPTVSEMRFTGLGRPNNPSKFFHALQKITGTDKEEEEEEEKHEGIQFEKRIPPKQTTPKVPTYVPPIHAAGPPPQQQQMCFGSAPKLKRPAAFLPKQQAWSYQRMTAVAPTGTDF